MAAHHSSISLNGNIKTIKHVVYKYISQQFSLSLSLVRRNNFIIIYTCTLYDFHIRDVFIRFIREQIWQAYL